MAGVYRNPIVHFKGNVGEFLSPSCLQRRIIAETHLMSSLGLATTCDTWSLHVATSPDSVATCHTLTPHPPSPAAIAHDVTDLMHETEFTHLPIIHGAITTKNMPINAAQLNALVGEHLMQSFTHTSDSEDNASDASSYIRPPPLKHKNRRHASSSKASECDRLDVTRVGSECSYEDVDGDGLGGWCEQDSRLVAEVLAAECSLPEAQKELVLQANRVKMDKVVHTGQVSHSNHMDSGDEMQLLHLSSSFYHSSCEGQTSGTPQCSHKITDDMSCTEHSSARKHLQRLCNFPRERTTSGPQEDPTFALQGSLQDLLHVARVSDLEQEKNGHASIQFVSGNPRAHRSGYSGRVVGMLGSDFIKNLSESKRNVSEAPAALGKESSLIHYERNEVKKAFKRNAQLCTRRRTQQTVAEEMYCKETIRRLVEQMQAEIDQWSQLQDILFKLQEELDGLNERQRFWEERAHRAEAHLLSLQEELRDWRCRAQSAQEELVMLRCEKQVMKDRIEMMEDAEMCVSAVKEKLTEEPRCASVGTRLEDFGACESFVHSRNESGRSSVDLGISQRSFQKSIRKSMNLASNKENMNIEKCQLSHLGVSTRTVPSCLQLSSKKADGGSKGKPKFVKPLAHFMNVNFSKPESSELVNGQERKKARLFALKDKLINASNASSIAFYPDNLNAHSTREYDADTSWTLKPKAAMPCAPASTPLPSAPASTPSRVLFGNIVNIR
ncbi:hypothetical protein L7F22_034621 [Adiantum nelumboides]|nr:hypothetical protein [Adiantum nelumboides]